jgi:hypothetical protein
VIARIGIMIQVTARVAIHLALVMTTFGQDGTRNVS